MKLKYVVLKLFYARWTSFISMQNDDLNVQMRIANT